MMETDGDPGDAAPDTEVAAKTAEEEAVAAATAAKLAEDEAAAAEKAKLVADFGREIEEAEAAITQLKAERKAGRKDLKHWMQHTHDPASAKIVAKLQRVQVFWAYTPIEGGGRTHEGRAHSPALLLLPVGLSRSLTNP